MASHYKHKSKGWQIIYYIHFPNGTSKKKFRKSKVKKKSLEILNDVEKLELLSAKGELTHEQIIFCLHQKYISMDEARQLTNKNISSVESSQITWDNMKELFIAHINEVGTESTRESYPLKLKAIMEYFNNKQPVNINGDDIKGFVKYRKAKKKATATIKTDLFILRKMYEALIEKGIVTVNPADGIKVPGKIIRKVPRILFPAEMKILLAKLQQYSYWCSGYFAEMLLTYIYTGLRRFELLEMKTVDINFDDRQIIVRGKGRKERVIDIIDMLVPVLQSVITKNNGRKGKYFFGGYNRTIVHKDTISKLFGRFRSEIELPAALTLHSLRHTFISYAIRASGDLKYVQGVAGHADLLTLTRYTHLIPAASPIKTLDYTSFMAEEVDEG